MKRKQEGKKVEREISRRFTSKQQSRADLPNFRLDREFTSTVGTRSWFFMPISSAVSTRKSSALKCFSTVTSSFTIAVQKYQLYIILVDCKMPGAARLKEGRKRRWKPPLFWWGFVL